MYENSYQSKLDIKTSKYLASDALRLLKQNKLEEALDLCKKALREDKTNCHFLNIEGLILNNLEEFEKAVESFDKALKINNSDEIRLNKANTLYNWAKKLHFPDYNNKKALDIIDEAIGLLNSEDDASEFFFLKAEIYEGLEDNIEARKYFLMAENRLDELKDLQTHLDSFKNYSEDTLINITGYTFYKGLKVFENGTVVTLIKEPQNERFFLRKRYHKITKKSRKTAYN